MLVTVQQYVESVVVTYLYMSVMFAGMLCCSYQLSWISCLIGC